MGLKFLNPNCNIFLQKSIPEQAKVNEQDYMLQFVKKLKTVHKISSRDNILSIHRIIYLSSFMYHHHLKKYFYSRNIPLNYCFICKIIIRGYFM